MSIKQALIGESNMGVIDVVVDNLPGWTAFSFANKYHIMNPQNVLVATLFSAKGQLLIYGKGEVAGHTENDFGTDVKRAMTFVWLKTQKPL